MPKFHRQFNTNHEAILHFRTFTCQTRRHAQNCNHNRKTKSSKYQRLRIKDQAMAITTCDHNLGFLGMVLRASDFDPLNNGNPFAPPKDTGPNHVNAIDTDG